MNWWEGEEYKDYAQAICTVSGLSPGQYHYGQVLLAPNGAYGAYGLKQRSKSGSSETLVLVGYCPMRWIIQLSQDLRIVFDFWPCGEDSPQGYENLGMEDIMFFDNDASRLKTISALGDAQISVSLRNIYEAMFSVWEGKRKISANPFYKMQGGYASYTYSILRYAELLVNDDTRLFIRNYPDGAFLPIGQANLEQAINDLLNGTDTVYLGDVYKIEQNVKLLEKLLKREETALQIYLQLAERRKNKE